MKTNYLIKAWIASLLILIFFIVISCSSNQGGSTLKMGVVIPLSGNGTTIGTDTKNGIQMAIDEQNASGGLLGKKIEAEFRDSKSDSAEGAKIIKEMMNGALKPDLVYAIISRVAMAIRPETEKNGLVLLAAVGTDKFMPGSKYTIRNYCSASTIGKHVAPFIKDTLKTGSVSIFYAAGEYATSVKSSVEQACMDAGLKIQFTQPFDESAPDSKALVAQHVNLETKCIFITGVGRGTGMMIKQLRDSGYKGWIVGDPVVNFPDVLAAAGEAIKGVYFMDILFNKESSDPVTTAFVSDFKKKFNSPPESFAVLSYEALKILFVKIKEINTLDSDKIVEAMNTVKDYQGLLGPVSIVNREFQLEYTFRKF